MPIPQPCSKTPEFSVTDQDLIDVDVQPHREDRLLGNAHQVAEATDLHKKTFKPDNGKRAAKLTAIIDAKLGPSAAEVHHFNIPLLIKQALKILKLEDNLAESSGKQATSHSYFLPTIVAACRYIQTKQSQKWAVPMKDFTRVCKRMGVSRPSRAIDLVKKWDCQIERRDTGTDNEESSRDELVR